MEGLSRRCEWALLPDDLLDLIAKHANFLDSVRMAAVCKSWALALGWDPHMISSSNPRLGGGEFPWLLLPSQNGEYAESFTFRSLPKQCSYKLSSLPEMHGRRCLGSKDGWLVTVDLSLQPRLLNPLTRFEVSLPSLLTVPDEVSAVYASDGSIIEFVKEYPGRGIPNDNFPVDDFREVYVQKIILSTPPLGVVVSICGTRPSIAMAKPGVDEAWFLGPENRHLDCIEDVVYREEDKNFYAVTNFTAVFSFDLTGQMIRLITPRIGCPNRSLYNKYIAVFSSDALIQIWRLAEVLADSIDVYRFETTNFKVFKMDLHHQNNNKPLPPVILEDLGDCSLFLGFNTSMLLTTSNVPGLRPSCIYFTQNWNESLGEIARQYSLDIGVFAVTNKTFDRHFDCSPKINWPPPVWFTPSIN